jgi:SWI/SNF-related matrix-associated actin-dependent regulator of chromatin subfamily A member 5
MPKEDRSDWVAVAPDSTAITADKIKPAVSAYSYFQRDITPEVKADFNGQPFDVGQFSRSVRNKWNEIDEVRKEHFQELARQDKARFAQESHQADVAAIERRERLQRDRESLMLDEEGGTQRATRNQYKKKERKKERKERKKKPQKSNKNLDENDQDKDDDSSSDPYSEESDDDSSSGDSDDSSRPKQKKAAAKPPRQQSQKQVEQRQKAAQEKKQKDEYITERQDDLKKEKASQAKRRLEFLLKQSNIFSHFGQVKQDQAKYGIKTAAVASNTSSLSRRDEHEDSEQQEQELDEADEHQATFLTSQPSTLAHGQMRQYQLEGLNWMIRLQENGVNGILADEVCIWLVLCNCVWSVSISDRCCCFI